MVNRVRRLLGRRCKVGHTGTLDSTASGLLLILTGNLTRAASFVMALPKRYRVTLKLGETTDTCDYSGQIVRSLPWDHLTVRDVDRVLPGFFGTRLQIPPKISAVRVNGQRAHVLARNGLEPEIASRPVVFSRVSRVSDLRADGTLSLVVDCHQGTYIRSLVRDIGECLATGAHVVSLHRERVGSFAAAGALSSERIFQEDQVRALAAVEGYLRRGGELLQPFLTYRLSVADEERLRNGQPVPVMDRSHFGLVPASVCTAVQGERTISFGTLTAMEGERMFIPRTNIFDP